MLLGLWAGWYELNMKWCSRNLDSDKTVVYVLFLKMLPLRREMDRKTNIFILNAVSIWYSQVRRVYSRGRTTRRGTSFWTRTKREEVFYWEWQKPRAVTGDFSQNYSWWKVSAAVIFFSHLYSLSNLIQGSSSYIITGLPAYNDKMWCHFVLCCMCLDTVLAGLNGVSASRWPCNPSIQHTTQ